MRFASFFYNASFTQIEHCWGWWFRNQKRRSSEDFALRRWQEELARRRKGDFKAELETETNAKDIQRVDRKFSRCRAGFASCVTLQCHWNVNGNLPTEECEMKLLSFSLDAPCRASHERWCCLMWKHLSRLEIRNNGKCLKQNLQWWDDSVWYWCCCAKTCQFLS